MYFFCLSFFFAGLGGAFLIHYPWIRMSSPIAAGLVLQITVMLILIAVACGSEFLAQPRLSDRFIRLLVFCAALGNAIGLIVALV